MSENPMQGLSGQQMTINDYLQDITLVSTFQNNMGTVGGQKI